MPPPGGIAGAFSFSLISEIIASVVSMRLAMEEAFWSADFVTLAGSMIPALSRSSTFSVAALNPMLPPFSLSSLRMTAPSIPAFAMIWREGSSRARLTMLMPT